MKTRLLAFCLLLACLFSAPCPQLYAAVTGRSADSSLAGTEKLLSDSSGTDTYILVSTLRDAAVWTGGFTATGSSAWDLSGSTGAFKTSTGLSSFLGSGNAFSAIAYPATNDGAALGDNSHGWSDVYLASGAILDFGSGNLQLTHSSGIWTMGTGELRITTPGTNAASVPTLGSTSTLTNKTATSIILASGLTASGSGSNNFSGSTGAFQTSSGLNTFNGSGHAFAAKLYPATDDGAALGDTTHNFSDLFLASGSVLNIANGDVVLTHTSGIWTMGTGELRITTVGTNAASVPTLGSTSTFTNKTLTSVVLATGLTASGSASNNFSGSTGAFQTSSGLNTFNGSGHAFAAKLYPVTNDGAALGDATHNFSDLFLATGAVVNYANGNVIITHSSGIAAYTTGELRITTPGTNAASVPTLGSTSTFTNKTHASPVISGTVTGTYTLDGTPTINSPAITSPTITGAISTPKVTTISGDGAITIASGVVQLTKGSAAAITIAAPSSQDGTRITIVSNSDFAHVVTFTGSTLLDGTTGANTTATFAAFKGASITVIALGTKWLVESINAVTPAP